MKHAAYQMALCCLLLGTCVGARHSHAASPVDEQLVQLFGASAIDCGIVPLGANGSLGWDCAVKNDAAERPFWFAIQSRGLDSEVWLAIGRDAAGNRYVLNYDSYPRGTPTSESNFTVSACAGKFAWPGQESHTLGCVGLVP